MSTVEVIREELTYRKGAERSYFKDVVAHEEGDVAATERLVQHEREIADEMERRDRRARESAPGEVEFRTNPNRTAGQGGNFAPPLWIIDEFATYPRAKRVLADMIPNFELPAGVQSVNLPRLTAGTTEATLTDLSADSNTDITDASVAGPVVTISGEGTVAQQLLDQSPPGAHLDFAFFKDLSESYDATLETQLLNGSGSSGQMTGLLNLSGIGAVSFTSGTPTATSMFTFLGQTVAKVGNNRKLPPEAWLMTTSRLAWLGSSEDSQNRPLMITDKDGSGELDMLAFPVKLTDAMPTNLGVGTNQDAIVACRPSDFILFESAPRTLVSFDNSLSNTLQVRIRLHRYAAVLWRYPSAIAALTGTGLVVQSGF